MDATSKSRYELLWNPVVLLWVKQNVQIQITVRFRETSIAYYSIHNSIYVHNPNKKIH